MDVEHILRTLNSHSVEYIVVGGQFLPGKGSQSCDVSVLVADTAANKAELNFALQDLNCICIAGADPSKPLPDNPEWMETQDVYHLSCPSGALDIYRAVHGLESFEGCKSHGSIRALEDGEMYYSLNDDDFEKVGND